jgi:hypothetical protein
LSRQDQARRGRRREILLPLFFSAKIARSTVARGHGGARRDSPDRIELVGCIGQIHTGKTRYGGRPYTFLMFGPKDDDTVRATIWSEGLATLAKHHVAPDSSWRGQWVSITGLVDSKYRYPTKRNTHVGITVRDTTQLRKISEVEARRRLQSKQRTPVTSVSKRTSKNKDLLTSLGIPTETPPVTQGQSNSQQRTSSTTSRNSEILNRLNAPPVGTTTQVGKTPPVTSQSPTPKGPYPSKQQFGLKIPNWVWLLLVVGAVIYILAYFR